MCLIKVNLHAVITGCKQIKVAFHIHSIGVRIILQFFELKCTYINVKLMLFGNVYFIFGLYMWAV